MQKMTVSHMGESKQAWVEDAVLDTLPLVSEARRGTFAFIKTHVSGMNDPKCEQTGISDIFFSCRPRYDKYLARRAAKIGALDFASQIAPVLGSLLALCKEKGLDPETVFEDRRAYMLDSIEKSQSGDRSDGHRQAADLCYAHADGVKLHLHTEAVKVVEDGKKKTRTFPVMLDGEIMVKSIMLPWFVIARSYSQDAKYKPVNSGAPVRMGRVIDKATELPAWKEFSLSLGNFQSIAIDNQRIAGHVRDLLTAERDVLWTPQADAQEIAELSDLPLSILGIDAPATVTA